MQTVRLHKTKERNPLKKDDNPVEKTEERNSV